MFIKILLIFILITLVANICIYFFLTRVAMPLEKKKRIIVSTVSVIATSFIATLLLVFVMNYQ